jgi:GNAT superfamily N-acetyltransferase
VSVGVGEGSVAAVEVIGAADRQRAVATLTLAFAVDPVTRWAWPDPQVYSVFWPRMVEAFGGRAFDHGSAYGLDDVLAVALWLPPGVGSDEAAVMELMVESLDAGRLGEVEAMFGQMDELHPSEQHWYLPLTGVDLPWQGQGLGSALLRHGLSICDQYGLPAYLEATSPRSRDLYARHGFEIVGVIQAGSSPPMWAMLRPPTTD